ncbi:DUF502 domain-containing protein [Legionella dresdenensis]|uniref:DUF502 domain-containing protein n=1 Tax=Legionella dresdenensis TaxID=450200 RepID=A0ABV8CBB8_9GAMM
MKSRSFKSFILTGLAVWLPIVVTFVVLRFIVDMLDSTIALLPTGYQPEQLLGFRVPGLGVFLSLAILVITGIIATNILGQRLVEWGEIVLSKIPLVRSIYNAAKQVIQAVFATNSQAFRKVMLIEYPRKGLWSIAFLTGKAQGSIASQTGQEMLTVFIPTTPNPTSGFLIVVPKQDAIELDMTTDEALKLIISLGVVQSEETIIQNNINR